MNRALTLKSGQTHVQRYLKPLLSLIEQGKIDPSFVVTHTMPLEQAPEGYRMFRDKADSCVKVVLKPWAEPPTLSGHTTDSQGGEGGKPHLH
jgi:threonine dehydrogenase-like Zn-dependent dehydrogenase